MRIHITAIQIIHATQFSPIPILPKHLCNNTNQPPRAPNIIYLHKRLGPDRNAANATRPPAMHRFHLVALITQSHPGMSKSDGHYKKPFVPLTRLKTLPVPSRVPASPDFGDNKLAEPSLRLLILPLSLPPKILGGARLFCALPRSRRRPFQPSNSRSRRSARSRSSRRSRSARLAASWFVESLVWSSSIVLRRLEILSRAFVRSSLMETFCFSRRSIWDWRSRTVRSTVRMLRASLERWLSAASRDFSSCDDVLVEFEMWKTICAYLLDSRVQESDVLTRAGIALGLQVDEAELKIFDVLLKGRLLLV